MAFTKINAAGIGTTETVTVDGLTVINDGSFGGNLTVGGVLTYEDVTNVDSVGLITARNGIVVGSGITLSKDGDGFFTGIVTATSYYGDGSNLSNITSTTINSNADNRLITGSGTANTLNGESNLTFDGSTLTVTGSIDLSSHLDMGDSDVVKLGDSDDFQLYHDGSNSYVTNSTGNLFINGNGTKKSVACVPDGTVELYYDDTKKIETTSSGAQITNGTGNTQLNIRGGSNDGTATIQFISDDAASDSDSWRLQSGNSGDFYIQNYASGSWETSIDATGNGNVRLMYDNSKKLETVNTGVVITGKLETTTFISVAADNQDLKVGAGDDLKIFHTGTNTYIRNLTGDLYIQTNDGSGNAENGIDIHPNGAVELYHNNEKKLFTTANGVDIQAEGSAVELRLKHSGGTLSGYVYGNNSNEFGFLDSGGNWPIKNTLNTKTEFSVGSTKKLTIDSDGLKFGSDTSASNALHDYEEGSWSASNLNYDYDGNQAQRGHYVKIGRVVHAFFRVKFHNQSTYTGQHLRFTGLPFTAADGNPYDINVGGIAHGYGQIDFFRIYVQPNSTYAYWYDSTGNNYNNSTSLNSKDVRGCITYTASS